MSRCHQGTALSVHSTLILVSALFVFTACAPKDSYLGSAQPAGGGGTSSALGNSDYQLKEARHGLIMLSAAAQSLELALQPIQPNAQIASPVDGSNATKDCRVLTRQPFVSGVATEVFTLQYKKCSDSSAKIKSGVLTGTDTYSVSYPSPVPPPAAPVVDSPVLPFPSLISVSRDLQYSLIYKAYADNTIKVTSLTSLGFSLQTEDATSITYRLVMQGFETSDSDLGYKRRLGADRLKVSAAIFKIDKKSRKVIELTLPELIYTLKLTQYKKSAFDSTASATQMSNVSFPVNSNLQISSPTTFGVVASCLIPEGSFEMETTSNAPADAADQQSTSVVCKDSKLTTQEGEALALTGSLCAVSGAPLFVTDVMALYDF